jgi:hypothetical protein
VVLRGGVLAIEYRDGGQGARFKLKGGQVDWDEPTDRIHRGVNVSTNALVRAHRWRRRIESGQARSITELAEQGA